VRIELGVVRWVKNGKAGIEFIRMAEMDQVRLRFSVGFVERRTRASCGWGEKPMCMGY
jgi:hypothetical protein